MNQPLSECSNLQDVSSTALFDNMQVILCLIREQDSISLATNEHFHPGAIKGREVWGGYSIIMHYPSLPSLQRSRLCRSSSSRRHKQKSCVTYRSNRSFNMPLPGNPPGIWLFWKFLFKFPPTRAKMPFKCPTLGSIQVIKCPHPGDISQARKWQKDGGNAFSCRTESL